VNIYVGHLSSEITEEDLRKAFEEYGQVSSVKIITDRYTGVSRGFAFVEMPSKSDGDSAINGLNGTDLMGQPLTVNEARPRSDDRRGGGRRPGRGGGHRSW